MANKALVGLSALLGFLLPVRTTARIYLTQELSRLGVDCKKIPTPCLQALADKNIVQVKTVAIVTKTYWRSKLTDSLDSLAWSVSAILLPENNKWGLEIIGETELRHLLLGFGVELPPRPKSWRGPF